MVISIESRPTKKHLIRKSKVEDSLQVLNLLKKGFNLSNTQINIKDIQNEIKYDLSYVLEIEGEILGYICGSYIDSYEEFIEILNYNYDLEATILHNLNENYIDFTELIEVRNLIVSEKLRGQGFGSEIVKTLLNETAGENYLVVGLEHTKNNKWDAETIFRNEGFKFIDKIENYFLNYSLDYGQYCNNCLKPVGRENDFGCYCTASFWLHLN